MRAIQRRLIGLSPSKGVGVLRHVGTRTSQLQSATNGTHSQINSYTRHVIPVSCRGLRLGYANWYPMNPTAETNGVAAYTKLSVGLADTFGGARVRVPFQGSDFGTLAAGETIISDAVEGAIPAGRAIGIMAHMTIASPAAFWVGRATLLGLSEGAELGTSLTDKAISGTVAASGTFAFAPMLILGYPDNRSARSVAIIGDSIPTGQGDTADPTTGVLGYIERGLGILVPSSKFTVGGDRLSRFAPSHAKRFAAITPYFTDAIIQLGVNDISNRTLAQMQADFNTIKDELVAAGVRVSACTITPFSTGTFTTEGGQSVTASNTVRVAYNDWLRGGVSGVQQLFEAADLAEPSRNQGIWRANYTGDGIHPNATGHAALSAAITPAAFGY